MTLASRSLYCTLEYIKTIHKHNPLNFFYLLNEVTFLGGCSEWSSPGIDDDFTTRPQCRIENKANYKDRRHHDVKFDTVLNYNLQFRT
mmetsp:Transcript_8003/g.13550  ORF Transcript_8003/g.13550 Transcript_8003/m.13550 type:complete len:88 (-) Transcript_8003:427-690(-)